MLRPYECQIGGQLYYHGLKVVNFDERFKHPCTITVAGPTKAGKSTLVRNIVKNASKMFAPAPQETIWCYSEVQSGYNLTNVEYIKGLPDIEQLRNRPDVPKLIIIDDLMTELKGNNAMVSLFTKGSHHWNCSVIYIVQDLFYDRQRTNRINSQYIILMKNPADKLTPMNLARQMFPKQTNFFLDAYNRATGVPHGYLLVYLEQNTPEMLRVRSNVLPEEETVVYTSKINIKG